MRLERRCLVQVGRKQKLFHVLEKAGKKVLNKGEAGFIGGAKGTWSAMRVEI